MDRLFRAPRPVSRRMTSPHISTALHKSAVFTRCSVLRETTHGELLGGISFVNVRMIITIDTVEKWGLGTFVFYSLPLITAHNITDSNIPLTLLQPCRTLNPGGGGFKGRGPPRVTSPVNIVGEKVCLATTCT